jgi:predicted ATPase
MIDVSVTVNASSKEQHHDEEVTLHHVRAKYHSSFRVGTFSALDGMELRRQILNRLSELGQPEDGIREMAEGIEGYRSVGSRLFLSWPLGLLAWAHAKIGQIEKAFSVLAEAFEVVENGERFCEAELFRLKGELLLKRPAPEEDAETCFRQAITIARRQEARTWELRATTRLTRLLAKHSKEKEALEALGVSTAGSPRGLTRRI